MSMNSQTSNAQAMMRAIYALKPQTLAPMVFSLAPNALETVTISVVLTPELIKAWADEVRKDNQVMRGTPGRATEE